MFLKKIELQGFKSFSDKTIIELTDGITTVIGPNGSGKSNVVDAIRWVLGEQSMKNLRGSKSEDIIFAGTQLRKPVGFAEVSLYIDNKKGILPIEYEDVVITRRIYRSGECEYLINKTICRLKDIQQLFYNTGVGKEGYSIIGQGKVEEILNSKSEDRRYMFEEAAGILKYRYKKNEAERKLENTRINLVRVNDIITEIEGRLESLCVQSEKAKLYLNYREELKNKEISLFNFNMQKSNKALEEINENKKILLNQINGVQLELEENQETKQKTKEEIEQLFQKQEEIQRNVFESANMVEKLNSELAMMKVQRENNIANFEVFTKEIQELKQMIESNEQEKESRNSKIELLLNNRKKFEKELEEKQKQYDEMYNKLSKQGEEIENKKECLEKNNEQKVEYKIQINTINGEIENNNVYKLKLEKEENEKIYEKDVKKIQKEDLATNLLISSKEKKKYDDQIAQINQKQEEINQKTLEYDRKINELTEEFKNKKARYVFLCEVQKEREGYAKAVKEILLNAQNDNMFAKGIEGSVADIISTPKEYELAVEMALGGYLQNIITLTQENAEKCISYLKENKFGRASFLPMSVIKGNKNDLSKFKNESGFIGLASDLVKYDKKYEEIVLNLLGKTVIVENVVKGIIISKKIGNMYKIVTLEGDVIAGYGQMTGGSIEKKSASILGRNKEIEELKNKVEYLQNEIEKLNKTKEECINKVDNSLINYSVLNEKANNANIEYAMTKQKVDIVNDEILIIEKRIEKIILEKKQLIEENLNKQVTLENLQEQLQEMDNINNKLSMYIKEYAESFKEEQKNIDDLKDEITNLKISISSFDESNISYEEMVKMIDEEIGKAKINITKKEEQKLKCTSENAEASSKEILLKEKIEGLLSQQENVDDEIENVKKQKSIKNALIDKLDKEIEQRLENISLLKNNMIKLENKQSKIEDEIEELKVKMIEEYEIPLEELLMQKNDVSEPNKILKEINTLKKNIKELGGINIESIEEYKESKTRFDFLAEQKNDLEGTENSLKKLIQEITIIMKEQFTVKFKLINESFGEVFVKLFGGGRAEIKLTDEQDILNCGVEIEVQPPGKKLQNMMLLSGGEKALSAIALLFGILKTNPSPFCVLDEIEAALDDINVYRFAQYVKEYKKNTQFLMITHRKGTMEIAETMYGVTMQEQGISKLISVKVNI